MTLARLATVRQSEAAAKADRVGDATDRVCRALWRNIGRLAKQPGLTWFDAHQAALTLLRPFHGEIRSALGQSLLSIGRWSYQSARRDLIRTVPRSVVIRAAQRQAMRSFVALREAEEPAGLEFSDVVAMVFPPPDPVKFFHLVNGGPDPWYEQLARSTRLASPDLPASVLAHGIVQGMPQAKIMQGLLPVVNGVRVTARRIARTEGIRVLHAAQMAAHEGLGEMVFGYELLAVHGNPYSRPWHQARNGQRYYRNPGPGQKGYLQRPNPPEEPQDPRERPAGTPQTAWNCLCTLTPLIEGVDD